VGIAGVGNTLFLDHIQVTDSHPNLGHALTPSHYGAGYRHFITTS
jgi:hypothetical protein